MRRSITFKFILCYIITIFLVFTIGNTLGNYLFKEHLKENALTNISITANSIINSSILKEYFSIDTTEKKDTDTHNKKITSQEDISNSDSSNSKTTTEKNNDKLLNIPVNLMDYLQIISITTDVNIWLLNEKEIFIYTSADTDKFIGKNINNYHARLLNLSSEDNVYIKGLTPSKSLCKIQKIKSFSKKDDVLGYLVVSIPSNYLSEQSDSFMMTLNILIGIFSLVVAGIFILIYFLTIHPIHKITNYAIEATQGKVNKPLQINSNDEYRDLGNALVYLSSELNNLDEYQRKFISNISHDFRSPLTSIKGYLEAMLDGTIPQESSEKFIKIILFEAERLTNLTTNLLTLNNLGEHKQMLDKTNFDINFIISKTLEVYEGRCQKQKITLETKFENLHQYVYADQSKIQQVINNLLDNAIKFSSPNSKIILSTYLKSEKVFISIKDYGKGIPKENISHIWERFYKIDSSRGKDKRGTGLGLSITKEIINAHHENINVTSTEGVGTEFTFSLPKNTN